MTKLNNSFISTRNNPFLLFMLSLIAFLTITFLVIPLTVNADDTTSTDEINDASLENELSVHNHHEQFDHDEAHSDMTSSEELIEEVLVPEDSEGNIDTEDEANVDMDADQEDNGSEVDDTNVEDNNAGEVNTGDLETVEEDSDVDNIGNEEVIDAESDEEDIETPESDDEEDSEVPEQDEEEEIEASEEDEKVADSDEKDNKSNATFFMMSTLSSANTTTFKEGDRHNKVIQIKKELQKVGFGGMNINNLYGSFTALRVKQFQKYFGLTANGIANQATQSKLSATANSPLQEGKRNNDTIQLKKELRMVGFGGMNINNLYGSYTAKRVKDFQRAHGLKVNGIADEVTLAKLKTVKPVRLAEGDRHKDIIQLKKDLQKVGFGGMNLNDLYGSFTATRVQQFQQYFGLTANGIANRSTLSKLNSTANSPLQAGKRHNDTIQLKRDLRKVGFGGMNINNLYGSFTETRVKDFQRKYQLKVNGIADEVTLKKIASEVKKQSKKKVVYLDAGHGGYDPGASANGLREKDLTLNIANQTASKLRAAGYEVIMSRTTDIYLSLSQRTHEANNANVDIFVSIHINAGGGTGIETWKMANGPMPNESNILANHLQNEMIKQTKMRDRGVKDKNLHVNRESRMPSALVEVGFIDTVADANKLKQASFLNQAATGIANGIIQFFK